MIVPDIRHDENGECAHLFIPIGGEVWTWEEVANGSAVRHAIVCQWCAEVRHVTLRVETRQSIEVQRGKGRETFRRSGI